MTSAVATSTAPRTAPDPREIAGFVIPLSATVNMNGTSLLEGVVDDSARC
jgi:Na+/H+-dicarboxylate symporter